MESGKILVIHQGAIGDLVLSLPAISALTKYFSNVSFHFMGYPDRLKLLLVEIDTVISIHWSGFSSLYTSKPDPPPGLKQYLEQFEKVVVFGTKGDEILVNSLKMIGVKEVLRIDSFPDQNMHVIDHQASILSSVGIEVKDKNPRLFIRDEDERSAKEFLFHNDIKENDQLIFFHLGSGSIKKTWPTSHFTQLAKDLQDMVSIKIAVIQGPADREQTQAFYTHLNGVNTVKIDSLPLKTLAAILKLGNCFVGNDSGITHLSAAVGIPTVALFGPTDPKVWGPRGEHVCILEGKAECSPCDQKKLRACRRQKCLENINVGMVSHVVEGIMEEGY
jgi:ADP-heptose:LPS heptosyltransferase